MAVVFGEMVDDAGDACVDVAAAEFLGADHLAGGGFHQGRPAEEDGALVADDDRFIAHGGYIGAAGGARTHHDGNLRNPRRRHVRLVVEDAPEVLLVRKHFVLAGQVCAARVHEIDAGQPVLFGHTLRPQVLLDAHRVIRAALHRRVIADHEAFLSRNPPDAGDDAGRR
jgi:hypothetical protein